MQTSPNILSEASILASDKQHHSWGQNGFPIQEEIWYDIDITFWGMEMEDFCNFVARLPK